MAKNKNTIPAERKLIWEYYKFVRLYIFRVEVRNDIAFYKKHGTWENIPREKPRKTTLNVVDGLPKSVKPIRS